LNWIPNHLPPEIRSIQNPPSPQAEEGVAPVDSD
jgi:hypothetical protein